jgi:hypothetical protein
VAVFSGAGVLMPRDLATLAAMTIFDGGITWVDAGYDERLGEMLRPLNQDRPLEAGYGDYAACDRDA